MVISALLDSAWAAGVVIPAAKHAIADRQQRISSCVGAGNLELNAMLVLLETDSKMRAYYGLRQRARNPSSMPDSDFSTTRGAAASQIRCRPSRSSVTFEACSARTRQPLRWKASTETDRK